MAITSVSERTQTAVPVGDQSSHSGSEDRSSEVTGSTEQPSLADHEPKGMATKAETNVVGDAGAEERKRPPLKVILSMFALCVAMFLAALDQTIITTALPTISADLGASETEYAWVGSIYLLVAAAFIPCWGKISDIFGRKPIILLVNVIFFIGSLVCGLSKSTGMLLAGRAVQGAGAGGLNTLVNVCISDMFSMRERGFYMGIIGLVFAFASSIGPIIGGSFAEGLSWRWGFYINLPFDGLAFILLVFFLDLKTPKTSLRAGLKAVDWAGVLLMVGSTVMILSGLTIGGALYPWGSVTVICLLVFGVVSIGLFVIVEHWVASYPIIPLRILAVRSNMAALSANFAHGLVFMAGTYYLPFYFQAVLLASPILSGVYLLPYVVVLSLMATASGIFIKATGKYKPLIIVGLGLMTLGNGLFIDLPDRASWARLIVFQIISGVGVGCLFQAPLVALQAHVAPSDIAAVTGAFAFTRHLASAISVGVGGAIIQNEVDRRIAGTAAILPASIRDTLRGGAVGANTAIASTLSGTQRQTVLSVFTSSLHTLWIVYTAIAAAGFLIAFFVKPRVLDKKHVEAKTGLAEQQRIRQENLQRAKAVDAESRDISDPTSKA